MAYGTRVLRSRSSHSSRRWGKPITWRRGTGNFRHKNGKVCAMQNAETILHVYRERGQQELPLERVYRQLFNPHLFLMAYANLYANAGAMTKGTTTETVDGMSIAKIERIIAQLREER